MFRPSRIALFQSAIVKESAQTKATRNAVALRFGWIDTKLERPHNKTYISSREAIHPLPAKFVHDRTNFSEEGAFLPHQVKTLVSQPCCYCESAEKMSIDRKDSSIGHIVENCVPCCLRCNFIKRDIPYEAWLVIVPAIKEAVKLGLFGNWTRQK
jgi:hypothetical protein